MNFAIKPVLQSIVDGQICCIALIKAGNLETMVKGMLGPVMGEILNK